MTTAPHIHGNRRSFSASDAVETIAADLRQIRKEDGLTWADVGRVLGKSEDRANDYAKALSEMPVTTFLLGLREWKGRFGTAALAMAGGKFASLDAGDMSDNERLSHLLRLAHLLSVALSDDHTPGDIDDGELQSIGSAALDDAARGIETLRRRLSNLNMQRPSLAAVGDRTS